MLRDLARMQLIKEGFGTVKCRWISFRHQISFRSQNSSKECCLTAWKVISAICERRPFSGNSSGSCVAHGYFTVSYLRPCGLTSNNVPASL